MKSRFIDKFIDHVDRVGPEELQGHVLRIVQEMGFLEKVFDALSLSKGPSFGTAFTLVSPYVMLAHYQELDWAEGCGVPPHLIRVSSGNEDPEVLRTAFSDALALG